MPRPTLLRPMTLALAACFVLASLVMAPSAFAQDRAGDFDFYVLALSWSPTYCETDGRDDRQQCGRGADHSFVVHGLWPQYERGFPEYCPVADDWVPESLADGMADLMPSRNLVFRQWRKHGTCSGLNQTAYFDTVRDAYERIAMPRPLQDPRRDIRVSASALEAAFVSANRGLRREMMSVRCASGRVEEVRICLTKRLDFRACPEVDRRGCQQGDLIMPAPG